MKKSYENYLKRIMEQEDIPVNEKNWQDMRSLLDQHKLTNNNNSKSADKPWWKIWTPILAALLIGLLVGATVINTERTTQTETKIVYQKIPSSQSSIATQNSSTYTPSNSRSTFQIPSTSPIVWINNAVIPVNKAVESEQYIPEKIVYTLYPISSTQIHLQSNPNLAQQEVQSQMSKAQYALNVISYQKSQDAFEKEILLPEDEPYNKRKLDLGIKAGVFSGTKQSGISGLVHVQKNFKSNVILESDMGFVNSLGSLGSVMPNVSSKSSAAGLSTGTGQPLGYDQLPAGSRLIDNENVSALFTVFNPSAGYQISKKIAVKLGLDYQQLMSNPDENTFVGVNSKYYRMAKNDFGVTPKVSLKLSEKLSSELVYRNGINSSIYGSDYWNRNYFFAQLNFNFR